MPPFLGGLVGFAGYELGGGWEHVPDGSVRSALRSGLPLARFALHDWVLAFDGRDRRWWLGGRMLDGDADRLRERLDAVEGLVGRIGTGRPLEPSPGGPVGFRSVTSRSAWIDGVGTIRRAIRDGEIYQANLSRRLEARWSGDPLGLWGSLARSDPAPFGAYLELGDGRAIVSASPEPFLRVSPGGEVATDPIKGTRPRGSDRATDRALLSQLLGSAKDRAENLMIVDVLRNDLGRVSVPGSVRVPRVIRPERTAAVQHLVSTVTGRLAAGRDPFDLLAAALPGGSITGAPKQRAIDLLATIEPVPRGPYTGAIGWIGPDGAMSTSIAIRTFVATPGTLALHVGAGITWRSDPDAEWEETEAKASGPLRAVGGSARS